MIKNILYATDLGLYAPYLLEHVMSLASTHGAQVHAVHAIEPIGVFAESILATHMSSKKIAELRHRGFNDVMQKIKEQVENAFADEFAECRCDLALINGIQVVNGKPADVIIETAQACKADLIVIGTNSQPSDTPMLGSVAQRVLSRSCVPVYLVPMIKLQNPRNLDLYR